MRKPNKSQRKVLANYIEHVSTVFLAVTITPLFSRFDEYTVWGIGVGLLLAIASLSLSLLLLRGSR